MGQQLSNLLIPYTTVVDDIKLLDIVESRVVKLKFLFVCLVLAVVAAFNVLLSSAFTTSINTCTSRCYIEKLGQNATYYDEVLTMSAYLAAYSGESRWVDRYDSAIPPMDALIAEVLENAPGVAKDFFVKTDTANKGLVEMETNILNLTLFSMTSDAQNIINSFAYSDLKRIFLRGVIDLKSGLEEETERTLQARKAATTVSATVLSICAVVGLLSTVFVIRTGEHAVKAIRDAFMIDITLTDKASSKLFKQFVAVRGTTDELNKTMLLIDVYKFIKNLRTMMPTKEQFISLNDKKKQGLLIQKALRQWKGIAPNISRKNAIKLAVEARGIWQKYAMPGGSLMITFTNKKAVTQLQEAVKDLTKLSMEKVFINLSAREWSSTAETVLGAMEGLVSEFVRQFKYGIHNKFTETTEYKQFVRSTITSDRRGTVQGRRESLQPAEEDMNVAENPAEAGSSTAMPDQVTIDEVKVKVEQ